MDGKNPTTASHWEEYTPNIEAITQGPVALVEEGAQGAVFRVLNP